MAALEFWFEFASTYSYPAAFVVEEKAAKRGISIVWRSFLLAPIFGDVRTYATLATAVSRGDGRAAERIARRMTKRVEERMLMAVDALDAPSRVRRR